jgi:uncharacterized membrane protein YeaQ/YmgE (transglycosylase-associated protein family)
MLVLITGAAVGTIACALIKHLPDAGLVAAIVIACGGAVACLWHIVRHAVQVAQTRRVIKRSVRFYNCGLRGGK